MYENISSLRELYTSNLFSNKPGEPSRLTHVFMDINQHRNTFFNKIVDQKLPDDSSVKFFNFKFIFAKVKNRHVSGEEHDLLKMNRLKRRRGGGASNANKRSRVEENNVEEPELVVLSDNEDDIIVLNDDVQTPVQPPEVTMDSDDDSDDDITVLEERLRQSRSVAGNRRLYVETNKALSRSAPETIRIDDENEDDDAIQIIEDEVSLVDDEEVITDVEEDNDTKDDDESPSLLDEEIVPAPAIEYVDDTPDEDSPPVPEYVEPSLPAVSGSDLIKEDRELVLPVISHSSTPAIEDSKPRLETHQEEIIDASSLPVDQIMMIQEYVEPSLPEEFLQQAVPHQTETSRQEDLTPKPYKVIYSTKTRRGGNTDEIKSKSPESEETDDDIRKAIEAMAEDLNEPKESEKPTTDRSSSLFTKQLKAKEDNASSTISPQPKPQVSDAIKKITPASKKITQSIPSTCKDLFKPDLVTKQTCASHAKPPSPVNVDLETQEKTS